MTTLSRFQASDAHLNVAKKALINGRTIEAINHIVAAEKVLYLEPNAYVLHCNTKGIEPIVLNSSKELPEGPKMETGKHVLAIQQEWFEKGAYGVLHRLHCDTDIPIEGLKDYPGPKIQSAVLPLNGDEAASDGKGEIHDCVLESKESVINRMKIGGREEDDGVVYSDMELEEKDERAIREFDPKETAYPHGKYATQSAIAASIGVDNSPTVAL